MFSTPYRPWTDGNSEAKKQIARIALRHWFTTIKPQTTGLVSCHAFKPHPIIRQNTSSTKLSSNQLLIGFRTGEALDLLGVDEPDVDETDAFPMELSKPTSHLPKRIKLVTVDQYRPTHIDAKDATVFAAGRMKAHYDMKHQPRSFNVGDPVNLRLHRGYMIPGLVGQNKEIGRQFDGPLRIRNK